MALVKFGGGIVQMSGSIAGNTFARNRFGNYVRSRTKPVNPNSARQDIVRSAMSFLTDRWAQTLTAVQRTAWNLYGSSVAMKNKLGETVYLTGFNHYIRSNMIAKIVGVAIVDAGPVVFELPAADPTLAFTASEATQIMTVVYDDTMDWDNETGGYLWVFCGSPQNAQRNFFAGPWRYGGSVSGVDGLPVASPLLVGAVFPFAELQHMWIYARIQRADGRLSEPFRDDAFCAA